LEKKLETVQLYNNAVKRHMQDLSADTWKQLVSRQKYSFVFLLQLEATDVSGLAVHVFVR
jgi:hypothetical protein